MVKFISVLDLRPGKNPEEVYKYWMENHTVWVKDKLLPEMKGYIINTVTRALGEVDYWGVVEIWFDDMESAMRAIGRLEKAPPDHFLAELVKTPRRALVREEVMIKP